MGYSQPRWTTRSVGSTCCPKWPSQIHRFFPDCSSFFLPSLTHALSEDCPVCRSDEQAVSHTFCFLSPLLRIPLWHLWSLSQEPCHSSICWALTSSSLDDALRLYGWLRYCSQPLSFLQLPTKNAESKNIWASTISCRLGEVAQGLPARGWSCWGCLLFLP